MAYQYWTYDTLHRLCMDAFQKFGFTEREADIIQDVLLTIDLFGIESHGLQRMVRYHKGITNGLIKIGAKPIAEPQPLFSLPPEFEFSFSVSLSSGVDSSSAGVTVSTSVSKVSTSVLSVTKAVVSVFGAVVT